MKHTSPAPLPPSATSNHLHGDQFRITAQHAFIQLPQPTHPQPLHELASYKFHYYNYSAVQSSLHCLQNLPGPLLYLCTTSSKEHSRLCLASPTTSRKFCALPSVQPAFHTQQLHTISHDPFTKVYEPLPPPVGDPPPPLAPGTSPRPLGAPACSLGTILVDAIRSLRPFIPPMPLDLHLPSIQQQGTWPLSPLQPVAHTLSETPNHSLPSTPDASAPLLTPHNTPPGPFPAGHDSDPLTALSRLPSITDDTLFDQFTTVGTAPANPDLDIHLPGKFIIQIGLHTNTHRPDGTCVGSLSMHRLLWLQRCYEVTQLSQPTLFPFFSAGDFASDMAAALLTRYRFQKNSPSVCPNQHWVLHFLNIPCMNTMSVLHSTPNVLYPPFQSHIPAPGTTLCMKRMASFVPYSMLIARTLDR